jgi:hypothetical protein
MKRTLAMLARGLHDREPDLSATEIADTIGSTRQAVEAALAVTHARAGRPGTASSTVRIPDELLGRARATAKREGVTLREFIAVAVVDKIMRLEGVPRGVTGRGNPKRKTRRAADWKAE